MIQSENFLRYRAWRGPTHPPVVAVLAIARLALKLMLQRRLFWALFALGGLVFFFFFYGQYLIVWLTTQIPGGTVPIAGFRVSMNDLMKFLDRLALNGTAHTYGNFIWFQGYIVVIALALAGSVLVGNDFTHGSLPFYLGKPISRWHYLLGKAIAFAAVINLFTTLPALLLFVEAGLLYDWTTYYLDNWSLLMGIFGYGAVLTLVLSALLLSAAIWMRNTVPMVMLWMAIFVFARLMSGWLVDGLKYDERWRLIDIWNNLYLLGLWCLQVDPSTIRPVGQPSFSQAAWVSTSLTGISLLFLQRRLKAVDVIA